MNANETATIVSGLLQASGYGFYIWLSFRKAKPDGKNAHDIEPNPTTWFMFAYGTAVLTLLEYSHNASWDILVLPITCAVSSLFVMAICLKRYGLKKPESVMDVIAFLIDASLTVAYIYVACRSSRDTISPDEYQRLMLQFLILSNLSTLVSFAPMIRETIKDPSKEHPLPWIFWMCAYGTLAFLTASKYGLVSSFMIYPAMNLVLHGLMAIFASRRFFR